MNSISQRIKYYRRKKGLTQMDVASALGIRVDNYTKYESGARVPRGDRLIKLAQILGVSYDALNEGVEREFAGLLNRHVISAVLGDAAAFESFTSDMNLLSEAYYVILEFFNRGAHYFVANDAPYYRKHIESPDLAALIALYDTYKKQYGADPEEQIGDQSANESVAIASLSACTTTKWAFCIAVKIFLESNDTGSILNEAGKISGDLDALPFFAVKVFVPYLSFIIDAVESCTNTTMDDFETAFLFDALTLPNGEDEYCDESEDD